ncbi:MAG TPA: hypothetical protein VJJ28_02035 [Candidatus Paceibacterota bacterium]
MKNELKPVSQKSFFLTLAGRKKELVREQGFLPFFLDNYARVAVLVGSGVGMAKCLEFEII